MGITCLHSQNTETSHAKYETGKGQVTVQDQISFSYFLAYSSLVIFEYVTADVSFSHTKEVKQFCCCLLEI